MLDPRFANPPEELELPQKPAQAEATTTKSSKKGKGRQLDAPKQKSKRDKHATSDAYESEGDLYDEVLNGPLPSTSQAARSDDGNNEDDEGLAEDGGEDGPLNLIPKVLQVDNVNEFNKKVDQTGLLYLSRIPPGMGPSKVKHILSNYGEIGRIYLVAAEDDHKKKHKPGKEHHKHRAHRFTEGWVEFMDKRVARSTAELLNARTIGDVALSKTSKKNGGTKKWNDDVWTMKYLPRFKWNMLSEQVGEQTIALRFIQLVITDITLYLSTAVEAATRAALLRNELAQSKKEQAEYLRQVDRAKNYEKAQDKKRTRQERKGGETTIEGGDDAKPSKKPKQERDFEQRSVIAPARGSGVDAKLGSVLDSLF